MKHIFIINPSAGHVDASEGLRAEIGRLRTDIDCEVYLTTCAGDATRYVASSIPPIAEREVVRLYSCGGDGTLSEVVAGVMQLDSEVRERVEVACYASGSGNDYVKCYGQVDSFRSLARLVAGGSRWVDVMSVVDADGALRYSINVVNFGFDAEVCRTMNRVRRYPLIGGRRAYTTGIVRSLFTGLRNRCRMEIGGEVVYDGRMLMCTIANGQYVGGKYRCAPRSLPDDGLLDVSLFRTLSPLQMARLIGPYARGEYFELRGIDSMLVYRRCESLVISSNEPFYICVDGEMVHGERFSIENHRQALLFVMP